MLATLTAQHQKIQNLEARLTRLSALSPPKARPQRDLSENGAISKALQDIVARIDLLGAQLQGGPSPAALAGGGAQHGPRSAARQRGRSASDHLHVHYWAGLPQARPPTMPRQRTQISPALPAVSASSAAPVGISGCGPLPSLPCQEPAAPTWNAASASTTVSAVPLLSRGPLPGPGAGSCTCVASGTVTITPRGEAAGRGMRSPSAPAVATPDACADNIAAWRMTSRCADDRAFEELGRMAPQPRDLAVAYLCPGANDCAPSRDAATACARPPFPIQVSNAGPPTASRGSSPRLAHASGSISTPVIGCRRGPAIAARIPRDTPPIYGRWLPEAGLSRHAGPSGIAGDECHRPFVDLGGIEASAALHRPTAGLSPPASVGPCFAEADEPMSWASAALHRPTAAFPQPTSVAPRFAEVEEPVSWAVSNAQQMPGQRLPSTSTELYYAEAADVDDAIAWAK